MSSSVLIKKEVIEKLENGTTVIRELRSVTRETPNHTEFFLLELLVHEKDTFPRSDIKDREEKPHPSGYSCIVRRPSFNVEIVECYFDGKLWHDRGPAWSKYEYGNLTEWRYYMNGLLHFPKERGPAVHTQTTAQWWENGKYIKTADKGSFTYLFKEEGSYSPPEEITKVTYHNFRVENTFQ
jgi:hypothetical protein